MFATTEGQIIPFRIYIPHWLDSMGDIWDNKGRAESIYIPHWLDSMAEEILNEIKRIDLHSTLVRFYGTLLRED